VSGRNHVNWIVYLLSLVAFALTGCSGQVITRYTPTPTLTPTIVVVQAATPRPTATPAPYTPAPTPTPTITPTPIIYVIARGDNLMAIANRFGVAVRDLQDINGIEDARSLRVGQELIIPNPSEVAEGTPTPQPTVVAYTVENVSFSRTPLGGLWAFGEIRNTSGIDLEQASVVVRLLDEEDAPIAEAVAAVQVDLIPIGGRAPFAIHFDAPPAAFASYVALPASGIRGFVGSYYRDLEARDVTGVGQRYESYTLEGKIANVGPEDAVDVVIVATLYDALGRVIGTRRGVPEHNVVPRGGETTFTLHLTPAGGPVASYHVDVLGRRLPTPTPTPG
jgi:LysM repeat protein